MIGFLALAAMLGDTPAANRPCANSYEPVMKPSSEERRIPLYASSGSPLVLVSVGQSPQLPFVFDTGSSGNLVSLRVAEMLDLPENGPSPSVDGNGNPVPGFDTCLANMRIDGVAVPDRRATAFQFDQVGAEGIISPRHFSGQVIEFDGPNLSLAILDRDFDRSGLGSPRAWQGGIGDAHPVVDISLGGVDVEARLDSGSDATLILPMAWIEKLDLAEEPFVAGAMQTASVTVEIYGAHLAGTMRIGATAIERPFLLFAETRVPLLGWPLIKRMKFYMDPDARLTWVPEE